MTELCIICNKDKPQDRELTCSKPCARIYRNISERVYKLSIRERKCLICQHKIEGNLKRMVCSNNCEAMFDKIINHLNNKLSTKEEVCPPSNPEVQSSM